MQEGDRIVYSKFAGTDLQVAGEEHILLKVRHASAVGHPNSRLLLQWL